MQRESWTVGSRRSYFWNMTDQIDPAGNEALRLHFQQLTERFLVPLNRYFQTLVPTSSSALSNPYPQLKPWSIPNFLSHLKNHGPNPLTFRTKGLSTKSRVEHDFYASFCMSATFAGWLSGRIESQGLGPKGAVNNGSGGSEGMKLHLPDKRSRAESVQSRNTEEDIRQSSEDGSFASHSPSTESWRTSEESSAGPRVDQYGRRASDGAVKALR